MADRASSGQRSAKLGHITLTQDGRTGRFFAINLIVENFGYEFLEIYFSYLRPSSTPDLSAFVCVCVRACNGDNENDGQDDYDDYFC